MKQCLVDQRFFRLCMNRIALAVLVFWSSTAKMKRLFETLGQWDRDLTRVSLRSKRGSNQDPFNFIQADLITGAVVEFGGLG